MCIHALLHACHNCFWYIGNACIWWLVSWLLYCSFFAKQQLASLLNNVWKSNKHEKYSNFYSREGVLLVDQDCYRKATFVYTCDDLGKSGLSTYLWDLYLYPVAQLWLCHGISGPCFWSNTCWTVDSFWGLNTLELHVPVFWPEFTLASSPDPPLVPKPLLHGHVSPVFDWLKYTSS